MITTFEHSRCALVDHEIDKKLYLQPQQASQDDTNRIGSTILYTFLSLDKLKRRRIDNNEIPRNSKTLQKSLEDASWNHRKVLYFKRETAGSITQSLPYMVCLNANHSIVNQSEAIFLTKAGPSGPQKLKFDLESW